MRVEPDKVIHVLFLVLTNASVAMTMWSQGESYRGTKNLITKLNIREIENHRLKAPFLQPESKVYITN